MYNCLPSGQSSHLLKSVTSSKGVLPWGKYPRHDKKKRNNLTQQEGRCQYRIARCSSTEAGGSTWGTEIMRLSGLTMCSETTPGAFVLQQIRPHCPDEESDTGLKSGSVFSHCKNCLSISKKFSRLIISTILNVRKVKKTGLGQNVELRSKMSGLRGTHYDIFITLDDGGNL